MEDRVESETKTSSETEIVQILPQSLQKVYQQDFSCCNINKYLGKRFLQRKNIRRKCEIV